jgi:hypothetical protein
MNDYAWLVRREFWENRAIWIVPAAIGVALTLAALFGNVQIPALSLPDSRGLSGVVLFGFGVTFFVVMNIYATWYLLDCLYADRKDRSVLFWKSLPLSDTATVLAKLFTGLIAIPLVYFIAADIATLLMAFIVSVRAHSALGGSLWQPDLWLQLQVLWLYLIVTTAIWYLPFAGYLLVHRPAPGRLPVGALVFRHALGGHGAWGAGVRLSAACPSRQLEQRVGDHRRGGRLDHDSRKHLAPARSAGIPFQPRHVDRNHGRNRAHHRRDSITAPSHRDLTRLPAWKAVRSGG